MFKKYYDLALKWARHRHAVWYLCVLSFAESSFFPVPPDVMLAPMALSTPGKAYRFAFLATLTSVLGGVFGYTIGFFLYESLQPWLAQSRYWPALLNAQDWFSQYGVWAILAAGFSPIPYKVFTITAGMMQMVFWQFTLASLIGRGARFFLVAALLKWGGSRLESRLRDTIDTIGWVTVALIILAGLYHWLS